MKQIIKATLAGLIVTGVAGCGTGLDKARDVEPQGSLFETNLYSEYLALSTSEYEEADYADSDVFAERAIASASGNPPAPEEIAVRNLPQGAEGVLTDARRSLVAALAGGAAGRDPINAAKAQAMFDCWMQEQEENRQPEDIAFCRAGFEEAMANLKPMEKAMAKPMPKAEPMPMMAPETEEFIVFFDFDSAALTPTARRAVADVAESVREAAPEAIVLTGHTDTAGPSDYNKKLSMRRVETVAAALKEAGVPASVNTMMAGMGEESLRMETKDGVPSAANRRVHITLDRP